VVDLWHLGEQISGYIDYAERMRTDDLEPVFLHKCRFLPKEFDLSYYNWYLATCRYSDVQYELLKTQSSLISCIELKVWHMKEVFSLVLCMQRINKNQRWRKLEFWWPLQTLELLADVRKCLNFRTYFSSLDQLGRETKIAISNTTANWQVGFIASGSECILTQLERRMIVNLARTNKRFVVQQKFSFVTSL
jgi:hypothetical protein